MTRHHHTKYGYKKGLSGSEHIVKLTEMLNLRCDFDLKHINPIFLQYTPAYDGKYTDSHILSV